MDNIYRENILDHYKNPRNYGYLRKKDASYEEENPFCGDNIGMQLRVKKENLSNSENKSIEAIRFYGEGCAVSMASASMLTEKVLGKKIKEVKSLKTQDILNMLGIALTPTRLKCALLPLEILQKTLALVK